MADLSKIKLNGNTYNFKDASVRNRYGVCPEAAATAAKTVSIPGVTSLYEGLFIFVKFTYANGVANPTLQVNNLDAKPIKRYGTTAPSTSAASSWNANSVQLLIYDGSYWQIADWNNTTYSAITNAEVTAGTSTSSRLITPARLKLGVQTWAPVTSVNGDTGTIVINKLQTTAGSDNTEYNLIGTATSNTNTAVVNIYQPNLIKFSKYDNNFARLTLGDTNTPGEARIYSSAAGASGYTDLKSGATSTNARTVTFPDKSGTVALTSDIPAVPSWALAPNKPTYTALEVGALASNTTYVSTVTTTAGAHSAITSQSGTVSFNVPTKTSHLTNDSGFITSAPVTSVNGQTGAVTVTEGLAPLIGTTATVTPQQVMTALGEGRDICITAASSIAGVPLELKFTSFNRATDTEYSGQAIDVVVSQTIAVYESSYYLFELVGGISNGHSMAWTVYNTTLAQTSDIPDVSVYAPLASPVFTGTPTAPTPGGSAGDTEIATVKYVQDAVSGAGSGTVTSVGISNDTNGGLSVSGSPVTSSGTITIGHSNVLTSAQTTQAVYPIKIDKNGHISSYGSAVTIPDVSGKIDTAGTGLSKSGTTLNHSNSVTAQTTQAIYPIKIDAQGHISEYGSAVSVPTKVSELQNDSGFITSAPVTSVNGQTGAVTINVPTKTSDLSNDGDGTGTNYYVKSTELAFYIDEDKLATPIFYACDSTSQAVIAQLGSGTPQIKVPSDFVSLVYLMFMGLEPRTWFAWINGTELELAKLSVSVNTSNSAITLYLRGRTSIATGIMGVDSSWTVTPFASDAEGVAY